MTTFPQHMAAKANASRPNRYADYPKAIYPNDPKVPVFVNSVEEENRALGKEPVVAAPDGQPTGNLIAGAGHHDKRPVGRPKKLDLPEGVFDTSSAGESQE